MKQLIDVTNKETMKLLNVSRRMQQYSYSFRDVGNDNFADVISVMAEEIYKSQQAISNDLNFALSRECQKVNKSIGETLSAICEKTLS